MSTTPQKLSDIPLGKETTVAKRLEEALKEFGSETPAFKFKDQNEWKTVSWGNYYTQIKQVSKSLISLGVNFGDVVTIIGNSRSEWVLTDMGAMIIGSVPAGIYQTSASAEISYIINHSECKVVIVETKDHYDKVVKVIGELKHLKYIVTMKGLEINYENNSSPSVLSWDQFLKVGEKVKDEEVTKRSEKVEKDTLGTLIYTSGTTGPPKAVMLSHGNLTWTSHTAANFTGFTGNDSNVSFLPLSHIAEQMFTIHIPLYAGSVVHFATNGAANILSDLKEVKPTILFSPPRLYEKLYAALSSKLPKGVPLDKIPLEVKNKMKEGIGLSNARWAVSGAAPIAKEVLEFFDGIGLRIYEVYGQSEDNGPTTFNHPIKFKFGSVGNPFPGVTVKLGDDDEVIVKGPNVFQGYYKDKTATNATLKDGWLHSGDLGKIDDDGFVYIVGRKKDIIITSGGKNITPSNIEGQIKTCPIVAHAICCGDKKNYLTALIVLDHEVISSVFNQGKPVTEENIGVFAKNEKIIETIDKKIKEVNGNFATVEQIKKFKILEKIFSVERGEITPTMKVKRQNVVKLYQKEIDSMYED